MSKTPLTDAFMLRIDDSEIDLNQVEAFCKDLEAPRTDLAPFWNSQAEWSQATFGTDAERGPMGPLKHLAKEVAEAMKDPTDLMEFVDCLFLVCDATRRAGFRVDDLMAAAWQKLEINKARQWSKPTSDEPVEHVRGSDEPSPLPPAVCHASA